MLFISRCRRVFANQVRDGEREREAERGKSRTGENESREKYESLSRVSVVVVVLYIVIAHPVSSRPYSAPGSCVFHFHAITAVNLNVIDCDCNGTEKTNEM